MPGTLLHDGVREPFLIDFDWELQMPPGGTLRWA